MESSSPLSSIVNSAQSIKRQRHHLQECYEETKRECELQEQRADDLSVQLQKSREENDLLQSKIKSLRLNLEHLTKVEEKYNELKAQYEDSRKKIVSVEAEVERKLQLLTELRFEKAERIYECESLINERDSLQSSYEEVRMCYNDELEMHAYTRQKLSEATQRLSSLEFHWSRRIEELEKEHNARLSTTQARLAEMESTMHNNADLASKVQLNYQTKIEALEKQIVEKNTAITDARADQDKIAERCVALELELEAMRMRLVDLEAHYADVVGRLAVEERRADEALFTRDAHAAKCVALESELIAVSMQLAETDVRHVALEHRSDALQADAESESEASTVRCTTLAADVAAMRERLAAAESRANALTAELDAKQCAVRECDDCETWQLKCRDLNSRISFLEENTNCLMLKKDQECEATRHELIKYDNKLAAVESNLLSTREALAKAEKRVSDLAANASSQNVYIQAMEAKVKELSEDRSSLLDRLSTYGSADLQNRRQHELEERNAKVPKHLREHYPTQWGSNVNVSSPSFKHRKKIAAYFRQQGMSLQDLEKRATDFIRKNVPE